MNISGVLVQINPYNSETVQQELAEISGVEVHAVQKEGNIILTIEDTPDSVPADTLMHIQKMRGVLSASLIYNYCDEFCNSE